MQHFMLLERNLIYTGITRARKFVVVVGQKKALGLAVRNDQSRKRYSGLLILLPFQDETNYVILSSCQDHE